MHIRSCRWKPFSSDRVNKFKKLLKASQKCIYATFSSLKLVLKTKLILKKLMLLRSEILRLLANTLTSNYEYSFIKRENLTLPTQMNLSWKLKTFSEFFIAFLQSPLNLKFEICILEIYIKFKTFFKKLSVKARVFLKFLTVKDVLTWMNSRSSCWKPFGSECVNEFRKLLKTSKKCVYPTFFCSARN